MAVKSASGRMGVFLDLKDTSALHNPNKMREVMTTFARQLRSGQMACDLGKIDLLLARRAPGLAAAETMLYHQEPPHFVVHFVAATTVRLPGALPGFFLDLSEDETWIVAAPGVQDGNELMSRVGYSTQVRWREASIKVCSADEVRELRKEHLAPRRV